MLKTLTGSDVNDHDVGLFAWVNFPYTAAHRAMKRFAAKVAPVEGEAHGVARKPWDI